MEQEKFPFELAQDKYGQSEKGKANAKKWNSSESGVSAREKYLDSEKGKMAQLRYYLSDRGKTTRQRRNELQKLMRQCANYIEENPGKTVDDFLQFLGAPDE